MKFRIVILLLVFGFLAAAAAIVAEKKLAAWSAAPIVLESPRVIDFPRGTSLERLSTDLAAHELVDNPTIFRFWVRFFSDYSRFQAGKYRFEGDVSPQEIARKITRGEIYQPVVLEFTIPEGFTLKQVSERLLAKGVGTEKEFDALAGSAEFRRELNIAGKSLEGYLYPATYRFTEMPSAKEALSKAVRTFWERLPSDYERRVQESGITLEQAVIMASLIELETPFDDEKPIVSEVIWRRLKDSVPLGIDASIIYGIPDYKGDITNKHLRDRSNPYNSRIHQGLPPTAIGSPSIASLMAVLEPADTGNYYYVLDLETGRHHFSKSYKEHRQRVRKLVADLRRRNIEERRAAQDARRKARLQEAHPEEIVVE